MDHKEREQLDVNGIDSVEMMDDMTFVLFGASGDLAKRKIYPALYNLYIEGKTPEKLSVVGLGRKPYTKEVFHDIIKESLETFSRRKADPDKLEAFLDQFRYFIFDAMEAQSYQDLKAFIEEREAEIGIPDNRLFYLSVAPTLVEPITESMNENGITNTEGWKRLIVEKPFGSDLASAQHLNERLTQVFNEDEIFRIDHYLGKPMVQNLESLIRPNPILKSIWNHELISNVQITASETVGVGTRAGYYDKSGAIRDMVQNHLLQLVMMTALHHPEKLSAKEIEERKTAIMQSIRPVTDNIEQHVVRGQYEAGKLDGEALPGYMEEDGVAEDSNNDTYFAARLYLDNEYWKDIPFYIRTGKRLSKKSTQIVIEFKNEADEAEVQQGVVSNLLVIEINPNESISLRVNMKDDSNEHFEPAYVTFSKNLDDQPEAYENLLNDAMGGLSTYFAHWSEVELSWKWIQPILEAFEADQLPLHGYKAGSQGPAAADDLLKEDGFNWW
ncbi:glucose-6-phosphate dehydrogenase [Halobacillus sp. ACCC02827]|uniref:glucose-6-phosphate dehydrogenase n=1 Tax=Halobacillus sp. ACCC02827 TaxID=3052090 RepID=UPI0025710CE1|nr:glucose-6-phosphate dehydrogenase [Halobacillus sp. ACCC02827]WJE15281.1 glucose-6-phosphate dehydrogenase [Halobacillus sp. ACCC02827]